MTTWTVPPIGMRSRDFVGIVERQLRRCDPLAQTLDGRSMHALLESGWSAGDLKAEWDRAMREDHDADAQLLVDTGTQYVAAGERYYTKLTPTIILPEPTE